MNHPTKPQRTDLEFLLGKMFQDSTTLGVEAFLTDAIKWRRRAGDEAAVLILSAALEGFLADPCGHLDSFPHLREISDWCPWGY